ncbi:hypothetical protein [uncultured Phenylobacterium sp.]|nr:hypothetical protein [uncultured Phenylobacterium sp.]
MVERDDDGRSHPKAREAKLAQALRANLRRRKAAAAPPPAPKPHNSSTD